MFKQLNNNKGFTLMETIISIATIAIISGFILQMFISSSQVNKKAQDLDFAQVKATSNVEIVKSTDKPFEFLNNDFFSDSITDINETEALCIQAFDKDWNNITNSLEGSKISLDDIFLNNKNVSFIIKTEVYQNPHQVVEISKEFSTIPNNANGGALSESSIIAGEAYSISSSVTMRSGADISELVNIKSEKYFVYDKVID